MIVISSGLSMLLTAPQEIQMEDRSACRRVHQTDKAGPHVALDVAARHIFWTDRDTCDARQLIGQSSRRNHETHR